MMETAGWKSIRKMIAGSLLCMLFVLSAKGGQLVCDVCGKTFVKGGFYMVNAVTFKTNNICDDCSVLSNRCYSCELPCLAATSKKLPDGRYLCKTCAANSVGSDEQAKEICRETVLGLDRLLGRTMEFPLNNSLVSMLNTFNMGNLRQAAAGQHVCATTMGMTTSVPMQDGTMIHNVSILSDLSRVRLMAVCAHEYTHAYIGQNHIRENRKTPMNEIMEEGFCELVAHKYMESLGETQEMTHIEKNGYTKGKIQVMLAADAKYGFNAVLDWMMYGDDAELDMKSLNRVRAINNNAAPNTDPDYFAALIPVGAPGVKQSAPTNFMLKSISGAGNRRYAMINNTTFETLETAKVRLGATNVTVQCMEIKNNSVTIRVNGSSETKQLFLSTN